ncbi:MAG: methyltransferase domain-containing protein [Nitrospinota bacterium]|nr:methyltransferase domain-containing protein [Nitrospinota bacterium]
MEKAVEETGNKALVIQPEEEFDPAELAKKIRERVAQKMESGFYDQDEIDRVSKYRPPMPQEAVEFQRLLMENMNANWDVAGPLDFSTHRAGLGAKAAVLFKKFYQKFIHRFIKISLARQSHFNMAAKTALEEGFYLRARYITMSEKSRDLEREATEANKRSKELEERVRFLEKSLKDLDRQGIFLKNRIGKILDSVSSAAPGAPLPAETVRSLGKERSMLGSHDYTLFENIHRGSREEIKNKLNIYAGWFAGAKDVLDIGCGRGELLELFHERGISAKGMDYNPDMVTECRARGFDVAEADALAYLEALPDNSLGGITAIQFVEHLTTDQIARFFQLALEKLQKGAMIAAETVNARCLTTFSGAFYLDMSHVKPVHPEALKFLVERTGFSETRIEYLNPYPEHMRLHPLKGEAFEGGAAADIMPQFNANVMKLNDILYSATDYAVVARK